MGTADPDLNAFSQEAEACDSLAPLVDDVGLPGDNRLLADGFDRSDGFEDDWDSPDALEKRHSGGFSTVATSVPLTDREGAASLSTDFGWSTEWPRLDAKSDGQRQWEANTSQHLSRAKKLVRQAQVHHEENEKHIHASHQRQKDQSGTVYKTLKHKMSLTTDLVKALEDRLESVEDTIRHVGECLFQLQRAERSKWGPLNVCERRLELRDTRPVQDLVRDHTQEALEHERQTLIESRQELNDQAGSCRQTLASLDEVRSDLLRDLQGKRHALRVDHSCLSPSNRPHMQTHAERVVLPKLGEVSNYGLPPCPNGTGRGTGYQHEEARQVDTKALLSSAVRAEEGAIRLCNESDCVMLQTKRECQRAAVQAQASLTKRTEETADLKKQLEVQMREIDEAITDTEISLGRTRKKLEYHEKPLKALDKQFDLRNKRTSREDIRDHVHEELETHLDTVKSNVRTLSQKYQNTKDLLDNLQSARQQLTEDYRGKLQTLKIDEACLKVTPRKAMELDRSDPRGGRCQFPSGKRGQKKHGFYGGGSAGTPRGLEQHGVTLCSIPAIPSSF